MKAAIYARVSTDEQTKNYSIESQIEACQARLNGMGITSIETYVDNGYSGEFIDRPDMTRLRNDLELGLLTHVMIYDPDRMARNLADQLIIADEIEKSKASLLFITGDYDCSPEGKLFFSMRGAIAVFEKNKIRERTMRGKLKKAKSGKVVRNSKPYGYAWDKVNSTYVINPDEAEIVKLIYELCINERHGMKSLAKELRQRGLPYRNNKPWPADTVYRILKSEMYSGTFYQYKQRTKKTGHSEREVTYLPKEEWIGVPVPAIVPRAIWEKAQRVLSDNAKFSSRNKKNKYLLSGLVKCGVCGMGMIASAKKKDPSKKNYAYYGCVKKSSPWYIGQKCTAGYISVTEIDDIVWNAFIHIALGQTSINDYLIKQQLPDFTDDIKRYSDQLTALKAKQSNTFKWYKENILDSETAEKELRDISKSINNVTAALEELVSLTQQKQPDVVISAAEILKANTFEEKRRILIDSGLTFYCQRKDGIVEVYFKS
ncbi:recombinase family protein [Sporomusa sphaeroides DSM 2875]|uniref:recombinase family protein n=1 Tax=Sporomusa sphaeroides TaxID=47679 RepID=UPI00202DDE52|nr:recombinase family protein [Sporomusa sphaeroides]MCM0758056.1 recombinase family protein [Sporomusa sphaeroides DSM 2875]